MDDEDEETKIKLNNELEQKIFDAFELFDHVGNKTVESQDIGTIIRSLGSCPLESDIEQMVFKDLEDHKNRGTVHVNKFIPVASSFITAHKYEPPSPDALLEAFHVLDPLGKGYITREYITQLMTEKGEPFSQDEIDEMLEVAIDPSTQTVPYEFYINKLVNLFIL
nr:EF-hand calcium-binding domain-containing protein 2-like isoform X2 [Onthophagus taurus]